MTRKTIFGTNNDDSITAVPTGSVIFGLSGNDRLFGSVGNDRIFGGLGDDFIVGWGGGRDHFFGGDGADFLQAEGAGKKFVFGGADDDIIFGSASPESEAILNGGSGNDFVKSREGNDVVNGGPGDDAVIGGVGFDKLIGGSGNDLFVFDDTNVADDIDVILDFKRGEDQFEFYGFGEVLNEFDDLDSNGDGVLDGRDAWIEVSRGRMTIDLSDATPDSSGTQIIEVLGVRELFEADIRYHWVPDDIDLV